MELKDLKKEYIKLEKKYKLPGFNELNEGFEIDRIERDTDYILREIRKTMMDKIIGYKRFLEMMLAPSTAPPMFMIFIKEVRQDERAEVENVYKALVELELESFKREIGYSEKVEAEVVKKIYETWKGLKPKFGKIIGMMERNWRAASTKKERGYFG